MNQFTKTATLKRLRKLAAEGRRAEGVHKYSKVEVGLRTHPVAVDHVPAHDEIFHADDDLADFVPMDDAAWLPEVAGHGSIVHLYIYEQFGAGQFTEWELKNVVTGWIGTPQLSARLVDIPGEEQPEPEPEPQPEPVDPSSYRAAPASSLRTGDWVLCPRTHRRERVTSVNATPDSRGRHLVRTTSHDHFWTPDHQILKEQ